MRQNMKAERARVGLTIEEVASRIGVHPNTLSRWESGTAEPYAENIIALARLYQCTPEYLLGMSDQRDGRAVPTVSSS